VKTSWPGQAAGVTELLLAEEALLLALDDETGEDRAEWSSDAALAGAVLLDLARAGAVEDAYGALVPAPGAAVEPALLADALAALRAEPRPRPAEHWVATLPRALKPLKARVAEPLVQRGVLSERRARVLGLFGTTRYVEDDPEPEREVRRRLEAVLLAGAAPDARTRMLVAVLAPTGLLERGVPRELRGGVRARAAAVAEQGPVGEAVDAAPRGVQAAITGAVAATTAATGAMTALGGSG
jgi:hypothetical protein